MLAYLYILLMFLLLPVRMLFSFISQFFWFPDIKLNKRLDSFRVSDKDFARIVDKCQKHIEEVGDGGDGAKFLSFYHFASRIDPENVPPVDYMYKFYYKDKTFMRHFNVDDNRGGSNFSGDMMAGVVFARAVDMKFGISTKAKEFARIINNISFTGIPFTCIHPTGDRIERGFIWPIWGDGADVLKCLAMLDVAIASGKQSGESTINLQIAKWLILITNFPLYIWSYDSAFMTKKSYLTKWFGPHSRFIYCYSGYMTTGAWYYKLALQRLFKKYGKMVPDIAYLYKYAFPEENVDISYANYLVDDYVRNGKGTMEYNGPKATVTHVENFLLYPFKREPYKVERATMVMEPKYRFETYIWERDPFKFQTGDQNSKRANCLDLILTTTLSKKF